MNKLRVAIVEDEVPAARLLHSLIARVRPEWEITLLPGTIEEAVQWFAANKHPDLLFLDIQLSDGTSFELLSLAKPSSAVIFTTAYDEYAIRAFSVNSIDYILKPIKKEELRRAFDKLRRLSAPQVAEYVEQTNRFVTSRSRGFLIPFRDKLVPLTPEEIAYFHTSDERVSVATLDGRTLPVARSLDTLRPISTVPTGSSSYRAGRSPTCRSGSAAA